MKHLEILKFWFEEIDSSQWWVQDDQFDKFILDRFADIHAQAIRCELFGWRQTANGRLAEIILRSILEEHVQKFFNVIRL